MVTIFYSSDSAYNSWTSKIVRSLKDVIFICQKFGFFTFIDSKISITITINRHHPKLSKIWVHYTTTSYLIIQICICAIFFLNFLRKSSLAECVVGANMRFLGALIEFRCMVGCCCCVKLAHTYYFTLSKF